jgi:hypothetical protein
VKTLTTKTITVVEEVADPSSLAEAASEAEASEAVVSEAASEAAWVAAEALEATSNYETMMIII